MKISLDDGQTWQTTDSLRIVKEVDVDLDELELHFNFTHEGIITDVWTESNINPATMSQTYDEIVADLLILDEESNE